MLFVAHAAIQFVNDVCKEKNTWHILKETNNIQYRWKYSNNNIYHVIAGTFRDPNDALECAKQLYVTLFYYSIKKGFQIKNAGCNTYENCLPNDGEITVEGYTGDESFFFWNKHYQGGELGPGVYEIENSIEEFDDYHFLYASLIIGDSDLNFDNVDEYLFSYNREAQEIFSSILLAENSFEFGMKMTIYCGLLEHLSENKNKDPEVISMLEEFITHVEKSSLSSEHKSSLKNFLYFGQKESSKQKCLALCEKYAKQYYGEFSCKSIIDEAYSIRSAFSHGENTNEWHIKKSPCIKFVVLDIVKRYMAEKERGEIDVSVGQ